MCRPKREILFRKIEITAVLPADVGLVHHRRSLLRHFLFVVYRILTRGKQFFAGSGNDCRGRGNDAGQRTLELSLLPSPEVIDQCPGNVSSSSDGSCVANLLNQADRVAAWALTAYLIYRVYSVWWAYGLWRLNLEVA